MMKKIWRFLTTRTSMLVIGWLALAALLFIGGATLEVPAIWAWGIIGIAFTWGLLLWLWRRYSRKRAATSFGEMIEKQASQVPVRTDSAQRQELEAIKETMRAAIDKIKSSKLGGQFPGDAALYELPWYMVIGNPSAGKSTAIASSGLHFPFADTRVVQGVGGTRNCDWFFSTEGILLDTAGRFCVVDEDRAEWLGFLGLLKKYRKKAPINGIIIAASVAELSGSRPEFAINLAKKLRQRVQELTEKLAVHAPVYVVFTKADLIAGFNEFFRDAECGERERPWGATLPYSPSATSQQLLDQFDARFDELYDGLKDLSRANMALPRSEPMPHGVFTFPLEFLAMKGPLRTFIATLFEEDPYQFKPVFRGFYFTSAEQEGESVSPSSIQVAQQFGIELQQQEQRHDEARDKQGYFLLNLFRQVIFADKDLVSQYASPTKTRLRYAAFVCATALVGLTLGGWSWSYLGNRELVNNVEAGLQQAVKLQEGKLDLQSRFEALEILQKWIELLEQYRDERPLSLRLGLYQGELLERKVREEYFRGVLEIMLKPTGQSLEAYLTKINNRAVQSSLAVESVPDGATPQQFEDASPGKVEDDYNALKTYLMLSDKSQAEGGHLNDQLTRYWRDWLEANRGAMPREQMIRNAERIISFYIAQINDTSWPTIERNSALVSQTRDTLRKVVDPMPALERVYADVKARAATRFPAMTVGRVVGEQDKELILGSYAIPGSFTREAWRDYVQDAFREAANRELQTADWVLNTTWKSDLSREGSPEQIQKTLMEMYKNDYAREWQKFLQGVSVRQLDGFGAAAAAMNRLGDPQTSPLNKLINMVHEQTSWDNPSLVDAAQQRVQGGFVNFFREKILRQKPSKVNLNIPPTGSVQALTPGPVGREFAGVARMVVASDRGSSLMTSYLANLSKLRTRFNVINNQGDPGPGAKQLMQQTLDSNGSELFDALKFVDEQMLNGMTDVQKQAIRPFLVRPLEQCFAVIVKPVEAEIDKVWAAQVLHPFRQGLAAKYPFASDSNAKASDADLALVFGPNGAIAKFFDTAVAPLVIRRGDSLTAKTWTGMGLRIAPEVVADFPGWVAPLSTTDNANTETDGAAQTTFGLQALGAQGAAEFMIEIDGQSLHWRGQPTPWEHMAWPNRQGAPGSRITAKTPGGDTVVLLDAPGQFGLKKMVEAAKHKRKENGVFELEWNKAGVTVTAHLRIDERPELSGAAPERRFKGLRLPESVISAAVAPAATTLSAAAPAVAGVTR